MVVGRLKAKHHLYVYLPKSETSNTNSDDAQFAKLSDSVVCNEVLRVGYTVGGVNSSYEADAQVVIVKILVMNPVGQAPRACERSLYWSPRKPVMGY